MSLREIRRFLSDPSSAVPVSVINDTAREILPLVETTGFADACPSVEGDINGFVLVKRNFVSCIQLATPPVVREPRRELMDLTNSRRITARVSTSSPLAAFWNIWYFATIVVIVCLRFGCTQSSGIDPFRLLLRMKAQDKCVGRRTIIYYFSILINKYVILRMIADIYIHRIILIWNNFYLFCFAYNWWKFYRILKVHAAVAPQVAFSAATIFPLPIALHAHTHALNCRRLRSADKTDTAHNVSINGV